MTITVSISQFRQNISEYLLQSQAGNTIILKDEKKNTEIAQISARKAFSPEVFGKSLKDSCGVFTRKAHPEWSSKNSVIKWLKKSRGKADRTL